MGRFVCRVTPTEVELHVDGYVARLPREAWPAGWNLGDLPPQVEDAILAWFAQNPGRDDLIIDIDAISKLMK